METAPGIVVVNRVMLIQDPQIRDCVREITFALIGRGEPLE